MQADFPAARLYRATALVTSLPWPWLRRGWRRCWPGCWRRWTPAKARWRGATCELAYPELLPSQREELHAADPAHHRPPGAGNPALLDPTRLPKTWRWLRERHGAGAVRRGAGRPATGVIVAAPHFGNWELLNQWLSSRGPIAIVYAAARIGGRRRLPAAGAQRRQHPPGPGRGGRRAPVVQASGHRRRAGHPARSATQAGRRRVRGVLRHPGADHVPARPSGRAAVRPF